MTQPLSDLEAKREFIRGRLRFKTVAEFPGFPFTKFEELQAALHAGLFSLGCDPNYNLLENVKSPTDSWTHLCFTFAPILVELGFVVAAIATGHYWLLLGAITTYMGQMLMPAIRLMQPLLWLSLILAVIVLVSAPIAGLVCLGFHIGYFIHAAEFLWVRWLFRKRAMEEELFFCMLFYTFVVKIRDNKSGEEYAFFDPTNKAH